MSSQTDPPPHTTHGFTEQILPFTTKQKSRSEDGFGSVSAGAFGDLLGMFLGLSGASRSTEEGFQIHFGIILGLVCSLLAAKDGVGTEAYGLPQPPRGLGRRMAFGFLTC